MLGIADQARNVIIQGSYEDKNLNVYPENGVSYKNKMLIGLIVEEGKNKLVKKYTFIKRW